MISKCSLILLLSLVVSSCAFYGGRGTIAELNDVDIEIKDADVGDGLDKAMQAYQKYLQETPESEMTPEALRRLADLKIEKEYGVIADDEGQVKADGQSRPSADKAVPAVSPESVVGAVTTTGASGSAAQSRTTASRQKLPPLPKRESEKDFEKRATQQQEIASAKRDDEPPVPNGEAGADLRNADADDAIRLYKKLLEKYPMYERNDQVLYQLSRAYEETGQVEEAMQVMNRLVKKYPESRYLDEVQFRRAEYFFTRKKYLDAEDAYGEVLKYGVGSVYYESALYKKGWSLYKQELYEEALDQFFAVLDYKVSIGYDFDQTANDIERKRVEDTFRVVSLSFSNLGGANTVQEYFETHGKKAYEDAVYRELAEFYFDKRRYSDAAETYNAFVGANPFHKSSPSFSMRVIDIYMKGGFPRLVVEAKKQFVSDYGIDAEYWNYFDKAEYPEIVGYLKTNLTDLAKYYHALYQDAKFAKDKPENFSEASRWYREFLKSFPTDEQSPVINYQLADLLLENKNFDLAAAEFERSAYEYPVSEKSQKAAYAAVYAFREYLKSAPPSKIGDVRRDITRVSLRLVDTFPKHEKATIVLGALVDDLFEMRDYPFAIKEGRRLIKEYPDADPKIRRGAWLVVAHSSYETKKYPDAEEAYKQTLALTSKDDKSRPDITEDLAASVYKQGEQAKENEDYKAAVAHFLRIAEVAPTSKIRPSAEYDAAAVLIQIRELDKAAEVLLSFRKSYPEHKLQHDVTKKIAYVYQELGKNILAAKEYERVSSEEKDEELIREAILTAAELYEKAEDSDDSLRIYKKYVARFPKPLELALETYYKIAMIYKSEGDLNEYRDTLEHIIRSDTKAGQERTDRTRYLAAQSSLVIIEPSFDEFNGMKLVKPFKKTLEAKKKAMKALIARYTKLVDYQVADVTAASTYYIAEIYYNFSRSLLDSERPDKLGEVELQEFNEMLEEQAYPFEEKAITVHETNVDRLKVGVYSSWIDRSIEKLATLVPARYGKPEESTNYVTRINAYSYSVPQPVREEENVTAVTDSDNSVRTSQKTQDSDKDSVTDADISVQETVQSDGHEETTDPGSAKGAESAATTPGDDGDTQEPHASGAKSETKTEETQG